MNSDRMINVLRKEYWNRADAFLTPLTGLRKDERFDPKSFLFWNDNTIHDYKLTISYNNEDPDQCLAFCKKHVFPILDRNNYLLENYDVKGRTIFVLDISDWAVDIQHFLNGKYSKFSKQAKDMIENYHTFAKDKIPIHIYAVLYPNTPMEMLGSISGIRERRDWYTPIEYICRPDTYDLDYDVIKKIGEIGTLYSVETESLLTEE